MADMTTTDADPGASAGRRARPAHPEPKEGGWRPAVRVLERELQVYRRLWRGTLFTYFVGPVLFLGAFGLGLGGLVNARSGTVAGLSYLQFVAPGLLAATIMQSAANESLWPVMAGMKWIRFNHGMAATSLRPGDICIGALLWVGLRSTMSAAVFLLVAAVLGALVSPWAVLALPVAVITGLAFAAPLHAFSAHEETETRFTLVLRFVIQPLFLFSGTVFPVTQLPTALQVLAWFSPLWHGVALCRACTTGQFEPLLDLAHLVILLAFVAAGGRLAVHAYGRRLAS